MEQQTGRYVSNGAFIAAAIGLGFSHQNFWERGYVAPGRFVSRYSQSIYLGISERATQPRRRAV